MKNRDMTRAPLKDVQNVHRETRPPTGKVTDPVKSITKSNVTRKVGVKPPTNPSSTRPTSNLPLPPRRHTIVAGRKSAAAAEAASAAAGPKPARLAAKRKPTVPGPSSMRPLSAEDRRRTAAPMTFATAESTGRAGLSAGAAVPTSSDAAHLDTFAKTMGQMLEIVKTSQTAASDNVDNDIRARIESLVSEKLAASEPKGERDAVLVKIAQEKAASEFQLGDLQRRFDEEKLTADMLRTELGVMKAQLEQSATQSSGADAAKHAELEATVEALNTQLAAAQSGLTELEREKSALEKSVSDKIATISRLESEVEAAKENARDTRRRLDAAELDRQDEIRRLKRDRDAQRDDAESALKKKNVALQESQESVQKLEAVVAGLKDSNDESRKKADMQIDNLRGEMLPKMRSLEAERDELIRTTQTMRMEAKQRDTELSSREAQISHLKESTALQESKLSQLGCEKLSQDVKIEALHNETARLQAELSEALQKMEELERQARQDASLRRKLHNTIQELKGNIRVFCRVRPMLPREAEGPSGAVAREMFEFNELGQGIVARPPADKKGSAGSLQQHPFKFDKVFAPQSTQATVFEEISELVQSALDGYRVCIFAYGQTGSGKTHTMLGQGGNGDEQLGMIPRAVRQIFESARELAKDGWKFELSASFLEIYNEQIRDLLNNSNGPSTAGGPAKGKEEYKISFDQQTRLSTVSDLTVVKVVSEGEVKRLIDRSMRNRATAATKANERSSRSHSVFRLSIEGKNSETGQELNGLLNLIDLAGSERLAQSKAEGDRLKETRHINRSLSALGDVIQSLANKDKHVPFRNSKLTYLLQDSLGGDSKTLMFVNVSHAVESFNESVCSLRFAAKVNSCHVGTAKRSGKVDLSGG